jgi:hypothetical protein
MHSSQPELRLGARCRRVFSFTCKAITVKGNEHLHLDENGLIDHIEVAWRPLPDAVLIQEIFAAKLGFQAMRLVPAA